MLWVKHFFEPLQGKETTCIMYVLREKHINFVGNICESALEKAYMTQWIVNYEKFIDYFSLTHDWTVKRGICNNCDITSDK